LSDRPALVISPEAPYPPIGGGSIRTASILEYLGPRYALDVVAFREPDAADPRCAFPPGLAHAVHTIDLPRHSRTPAARVARNLLRLGLSRPPLNDRFAGFESAISQHLAGRSYDVAIIEHFWCAPYVEQVAPHASRTILDLHNVESALYASLADTKPWPISAAFGRFARAAARMEARWIPRFSAVLATSEEDVHRIRGIAPASAMHVFPNALSPTEQPLASEEDAIVFSGNFEYAPNVSAVRFFRSQVWPRLRERWPGFRWRLVGRNAHGIARYIRGDARIEVTGPVADAVAELAKARVVVAPLLAGSGTRFKILEAWAAGRAVVSTTLGAEGLAARDGEHLLVADTPESFAAAVSGLLDSPEARARLGAAGRALLEREYVWPRAWEALARCLPDGPLY
jgi:glycosyltransferase involved in cell wall biosynthesis